MKKVMRPCFWKNSKEVLGNKIVFSSEEILWEFLKQHKLMLTNEGCE